MTTKLNLGSVAAALATPTKVQVPDTPPVPENRQVRPAPPKPKPASSDSDGGARIVSIRIPQHLALQLRERAKTENQSRNDTVLDAIEANLEQLSELLQPPPTAETSLFPRLARTDATYDSVNIQLRFSAKAVSIIDDMVTQYGAPSRTALINAALTSYLTTN